MAGAPPSSGAASMTAQGTGATNYQPGGSYYYSSVSGTHKGCLVGPTSGADFDLYLQKWNGSMWVTVASSTSASANGTISYTGTAGYYTWQVYSHRGSGGYSLWLVHP